ncbi:hypothetical protein AMAG_18043 [Allomyces macrogynus ATCC 38327]|uniref:B30.2/SPRY domain-containing protein n=1 Tax=Allomyces macrogynus (strain ATCC 38327) TaxID=578462 RepID=A0A0L0S4B6_ALLM3|nr:hypothetical protein AMAG_18043 [Allomyces macrogynus ATCC 38327]|eukprot:KNE57362.1 hypothetical protein AMAG_18043 [Allomyces macrogynus ATCC 38327]
MADIKSMAAPANVSVPILVACAVTGLLMAISTARHARDEMNAPRSRRPSSGVSEDEERRAQRKRAHRKARVVSGEGPMGFLRNSKRLEACIRIESLAELTQTPSVLLRGTATRILLDRVAQPKHLAYITQMAMQTDNPIRRHKAVTVLQQLAKIDDHHEILIQEGVPFLLAHVLATSDSETTLREATVALYELVSSHEETRIDLVRNSSLLDSLKELLTSRTRRELVQWTVLLVHSLATTEPIRQDLAHAGFILLLGHTLRIVFGNAAVQKLCFHALVRLVGSLPDRSSQVYHLQSLEACHIVGLVSGAIRTEDLELTYWATGLVRELALKDVFRDELRRAHGLARSLVHLVSTQDLPLTKIVLLILKFLGLRQVDYQHEIVALGVVPKAMACLVVGDEDCEYWALALLHDLASVPEANRPILEAREFPALIKFVSSSRRLFPLYAVDIITQLCGSPSVHPGAIAHAKIPAALPAMLRADDPDVALGALGIVFNLSTVAVETMDWLTASGVPDAIGRMLVQNPRPRVGIMAAKLLCGLVMHAPDMLIAWLADDVLQPYVLGTLLEVNHEFMAALVMADERDDAMLSSLPTSPHDSTGPFSPTAPTFPPSASNSPTSATPATPPHASPETSMTQLHNDEQHSLVAHLDSPLSSAAVVGTADLGPVPVNHLAEQLEGIVANLSVFAMFPDIVDQLLETHADILELFVDALFDLLMLPLVDDHLELKPPRHLDDRAYSPVPTVFTSVKNSIAMAAMQLLALLFRHDTVLIEPVMGALARCGLHLSRSMLRRTPRLATTAWRALVESGSTLVQFDAALVLDHVMNQSPDLFNEHGANHDVVRLSSQDKTVSLMTCPAGIEAWNTTWAFESVRATHGVHTSGRFMFEVELLSDGLFQIGWASQQCHFNLTNGRGVGDDEHSYAYDGKRCKKWHGQVVHSEGMDYGMMWSPGDRVGCMIDLDEATISYSLNGHDLGIAFEGVNSETIWYPALSMSSNQGCRVHFGHALDPIYFPNADYVPLGEALLHQAGWVVSNAQDATFKLPISPTTAPRSPLHLARQVFSHDLPAQADCSDAAADTLLTVDSAESDTIDGDDTVLYLELNIEGLERTRGVAVGVLDRFADGAQIVFRVGPTTMTAELVSRAAGSGDEHVLVTVDAFHVADGDVLGVGMTAREGEGGEQVEDVYVTHGGHVVAAATVHGWNGLRVPFYRGVGRSLLNAGQRPFAFGGANGMYVRQRILERLAQQP